MDSFTFRERGQRIKDKTRARLTDRHSWKLPKQTSSIAPSYVWSNADQDPVPEDKRTWTSWAFIGYWYSDLVTVSTWTAASAIMTTGLTATDAILIVLVAAICNAIPTVLNGAIGADLHIPFPIACRASYGYWLSYFCVVTRAILALFWFGVQSANGGSCVTAIITAIWPSYAHLPNSLPKSAGTTSQGLLSYFIYWCIQFPLLLIPSHRLQYLFWVKTVLVTPMALAMVVWITVAAGGNGEFFYAPATVGGSARAWLWLSNLTSVTGGYSTLAVNIPDFSRFSKTRGAQLWQLPFIPLFKTLVGIFGIVSASASKQVYGTVYWSPLDIINRWQGSPGGRAAAFFAASIWLLAQISVNVSANGISFANDVTTLAPKWFNIRRGVVLVQVLGGWALCPWIIVSSAAAFLNFMSAYAIFMAPIAGVLVADYWVVKKRRYDVPALYDPEGIYRYKYGVNWRALVATAIVIVPLLPALAKKVTPANVHISQGLVNLFTFNWLYGFFVAVVLYCGLNYWFPDRTTLIPHVVPGDASVVRAVDADVESGTTGDEKMREEVRTEPERDPSIKEARDITAI
ncbi:uracil permease [Annulohypoxylon maeteangense]|uniref:uracil permease n=1 Tax=Annulohypoxylon maeteangense TaxID=1927788 RepID=UPI002007E042|nr:uracil permease [Annulohypoxylon maeteangense]KAI0884809.1 uracil permease [Annulohypoxylon maeteangense]